LESRPLPVWSSTSPRPLESFSGSLVTGQQPLEERDRGRGTKVVWKFLRARL